MEGQTFLRDGVMMVRVPDGREFRVSDVMRLNNPGMEYDDMTGEAMAMTPPRDGGGGSSKPREYSFGDVGSETLARTIDDVSSTAGGGGEITRSLLPEDWQQTFPDAMLAAGDYGLAGLLGLVGGVETAAGYAGDAVERAQNAVGLNGRYAPGGSAKALQADLMGMFDAAGAGPEGRMIAAIKAALPAGASRAAARAVVDRLNQPGQMPTTYSNPIPGLLGDASSAAADPAIQRADEVLGLLKSGRTDEVTDAMLDMGDPVLNARMNEHLYRNYDLPMDAASRMERAGEMGFSPALHGTGADISAVDPSFFGSGKDALGSGFYTTTNANRANIYAPKARSPSIEASKEFAEGANVMPLSVRMDAPFDLAQRTGAASGEIGRAASVDPYYTHDPRLSGDLISGQGGESAFLDPYHPRFQTLQRLRAGFGPQTTSDFLSDAGYSGVVGPEAGGNLVRVSYRPEDIRSAFARFDPRLSHLRNLNAALAAGVPLGLLSMGEEE